MVQLNNALGLDCVIETLAHVDSTSTVSCWGLRVSRHYSRGIPCQMGTPKSYTSSHAVYVCIHRYGHSTCVYVATMYMYA